MRLSDFIVGRRYLLRGEYPYNKSLFEVKVVEVAKTAVKFRYSSGFEQWKSELEVAGYTCQEVLP